MYQPSFGRDNPIIFETQEIYYETLGFFNEKELRTINKVGNQFSVKSNL